jgi:hypothetical protein
VSRRRKILSRDPGFGYIERMETKTTSYALAYARFMFASRDHVLAQSELVGLYGRG